MPEQLESFDGPSAYLTTLQSIVMHCIDADLLERQHNFSQFSPEFAPIEAGVSLTLAAVPDNYGEMQTTWIGNVHHIRYNSVILAGAELGNYCVIGSDVTVDELAIIEPFAHMDHHSVAKTKARVEHGAKVRVNSSVGVCATVGAGGEVSYDTDLPAHWKVLPGSTFHPYAHA